MGICPLSGLPCDEEKNIKVNDLDIPKNVCSSCISKLTQKFVGDVLHDIFGIQKNDIDFDKLPIPTCIACGHTIYDIAKSKKLGCSNCYEFFREELLPLIKTCHAGATKHVGKRSTIISTLQKEIEEAIKTENYEQAAIIKFKIDKLK